MNKTINVLVFPAGEVNSIEIHDALSTCVNVKVIGASSVDRHGPYVFENYISGLPMISDENFISKFNEVIEEDNIDVIFPTHDTVAEFLAARTSELKAKLIAADSESSKICRDKKLTYELFADCDFSPKTYSSLECLSLPVFIKPRKGQGSVGARKITDVSELELIDFSEYVVCEYLPGEEYTVDCLTDNKGNLLMVSPRLRRRTMAGISVSGETEDVTEEISKIAETINHRLNFLGLWWFQIKKDNNDKWKLLEISTRCAGTMALTRSLGVNLPLLSVYTAMGRDVAVCPNKYHVKMDSTLIRRIHLDIEYDKVYIDFDDTIIVRGKVLLKAIWFLYQCQNAGKDVILITRHENDLSSSLDKYNISKRLFSQILHIKNGESKSCYIEGSRSIFIDNSWQERVEVSSKLGIPVFDVDGLEFLMDWRT